MKLVAGKSIPWQTIAAATLLPLAALALQWLLWPYLQPLVWFLFFPAVFFSARIGGRRSGLPATLLSALLVWYFFIPPQLSWYTDNPSQLWSVALFLVMGYLFSESQERLRRANRANEQALQESRAHFDLILQANPNAMLMVDADGRIAKVNPEAEHLFGYPAASLIGMLIECLIPERFRAQHEQHRRDFAANPQPRAMGLDRELYAETSAGTTFPVEVSLAPITIKDRAYVVATVVDISARKRAETLLRTSQSQLRTFVEQAPVSVAMLDRNLRYLVTSNRWVEEYGRGHRELIGKLHYEVHPDIPEDWKRCHRDALAGAFLKNDEDLWVQADGSPHWLRWAVYPWNNDLGEIGGIIISAENITARKLAEDQVRKLNAGLERRVAERTADLEAANRELDAFAYAVSHDLRGPLRAMSGFSSALDEDYGEQLPAAARTYLAQIKQSSHRMSELIDGILTLSRSARGELRQEIVDLSEIAHRVRQELERDDPQHQVAWEIQAGMVVRGDGRMLEAVVRNLLGNAWKYSSHAAAPQIRFYAENSGAWRRYCVADNGAGFDMAYAHSLFTPFQRLHRQDEFPGIGVGLATVRRIVQRHGGEIHAQGALGQGAVFCFTLPQADAGAETA